MQMFSGRGDNKESLNQLETKARLANINCIIFVILKIVEQKYKSSW